MNSQVATAKQLPPTEVFYVGTHTDMRGRKLTFTHDDLKASAAAYDPALFAAPLVIGHPATNEPALGWINKLEVNAEGRMSSIDPTDVHPEFAALVTGKRFPRVSMSFFGPDAPDNPKPGVWYPKHWATLVRRSPRSQVLRWLTSPVLTTAFSPSAATTI